VIFGKDSLSIDATAISLMIAPKNTLLWSYFIPTVVLLPFPTMKKSSTRLNVSGLKDGKLL
jgi:hypothetical protein